MRSEKDIREEVDYLTTLEKSTLQEIKDEIEEYEDWSELVILMRRFIEFRDQRTMLEWVLNTNEVDEHEDKS